MVRRIKIELMDISKTELASGREGNRGKLDFPPDVGKDIKGLIIEKSVGPLSQGGNVHH